MSALAAWLRRWQAIAIHSAILAGARPKTVAGAFGDTVKATFDRWHEWAIEQRDFVVKGRPGISAEKYDRVAQQYPSMGIWQRN